MVYTSTKTNSYQRFLNQNYTHQFTLYGPLDVFVQRVQVQEHIFDAVLCNVPSIVVELEKAHHGQRTERFEYHV